MKRFVKWLAREELAALEKQKAELEMRVNQRVADVIAQMDPFEPVLRKYNVIFSEEYTHPESKLSEQSQLQFFMWASAQKQDPYFGHLMDWIRNTQGNATLRQASNDREWDYGRAAIATITLLIGEVGRLASRYEDILARRDQGFNENLPVGNE